MSSNAKTNRQASQYCSMPLADKKLLALTALLGASLLFFLLQQPSGAANSSPTAAAGNESKQHATQGYTYAVPAYSHMVRRPEDVFPTPASGAWVYFVGINQDKTHYLHWALTSIQCLQNTNTRWDIVVFFEVGCFGDVSMSMHAHIFTTQIFT